MALEQTLGPSIVRPLAGLGEEFDPLPVGPGTQVAPPVGESPPAAASGFSITVHIPELEALLPQLADLIAARLVGEAHRALGGALLGNLTLQGVQGNGMEAPNVAVGQGTKPRQAPARQVDKARR